MSDVQDSEEPELQMHTETDSQQQSGEPQPGESQQRRGSSQPRSQLEWKQRGREMLLQSQLTYRNSMPFSSGYERMYVGVHGQSPGQQQASVQRLAASNPDKVPSARSRYGPRYEEMGVFGTYQANANGRRKDGFKA